MITFNTFRILYAGLAALLLFLATPASAAYYLCNDGSTTYSATGCDGHGGVKSYYTVCGDGIVDTGEQCDNGSNNSDNDPNACRTDCRFAYCGDGVIDSGEQCDREYLGGAICTDFDKNGVMSNSIQEPWYWGGTLKCSNSCKYDLSQCHYCGDGIVQSQQEQCDDGNNIDDDGCNSNCTSCITLTTNPEIIGDTQVCTANYSVDDYGDLGAIIIKAPNLTLDCDGAKLTGTGDGIGIYIKRSDNVTVKNCLIDNYEFGIYAEDSDNIQVLGMGNHITNTTDQLVLDNSTAQPAPPPEMQQFGGGVNPNAQALMGQQIQPKTVTPQVGDALKVQALPKAAAKGALTQPAKPAVESREERRARLKAERERRRTPTSSKDARAVTEVAPRRITPPRQQHRENTPVILHPRLNQQFPTTTTINAEARFDSKRKVVYLLKQLPNKSVVRRSRDGRFGKLAPGRYCVAAAYLGKGEKESPCIEFSVQAQRKRAPLQAPLKLPRQ